MSENAKKIEKIMEEHRILGEIVEDTDNVVAVEISWGDWKHEHARLRWLVLNEMQNVKKCEETTTEEDGTDCYSAIHKFVF